MGGHKEWRKIAKKERRRKIRKAKAKERCEKEKAEEELRKNDENYQLWLAEQAKMEAFKAAEAERIHDEENEKWLRTELLAQKQWRELQEKISKARLEKAEQELKIRQEWEAEQKKIKEAEERKKKIDEERIRCHEELMKRIEEFASGHGDLPSELCFVTETNSDKEVCPFFSKIGVCRFGDSCSRNHKKPGVSRILLVKNFYSHFGIEQSAPNEYDTDILLEYDDKETYNHFKEFFDDVLPEFQQYGNVIQFKVCCNFERHLRGNTYIEYSSLRDAVKAYRSFHGRWYGGKQISLQFCEIPSWNQAICGLYSRNRCPKGKSCNFLHVFRNPGNMFSDYERRNGNNDFSNRSHHGSRSSSRNKENGSNWRWSESPEPVSEKSSKKIESRESKDGTSKRRKRDRSSERKRDRSRERTKHRSSSRRSRSRSGSRSSRRSRR